MTVRCSSPAITLRFQSTRFARRVVELGLAIFQIMSYDGMRTILSTHLAKFRTWSYADLAERVECDRQLHSCLEHIEDTAPDGTQYQMEFLALWDGKPHGDIRVCGDISAKPQKRFLGVLPIFISDVSDSFIRSPDGRFVGEHETS